MGNLLQSEFGMNALLLGRSVRLVLGVHHDDVGDGIYYMLAAYTIYRMAFSRIPFACVSRPHALERVAVRTGGSIESHTEKPNFGSNAD